MNIDKTEIVRLTEEYGGVWAVRHSQRLLKLIAAIGEDIKFNSEALWLAAYLHDWGAYAPWAQKDVEHALRSWQVAESFLAERSCPQDLKTLVLECIERHHTGGSDCSIEAVLLRDADALDFLGAVGVLRIFSKNPRNLRAAYDETIRRRDMLLGQVHLEKAKEMATERVFRMNALLSGFEADTYGCF